MNIDKNLLGQLANLDDRSLTAAIKMFAASSGIPIEGEFDKTRLDALRAAFRTATDEDIADAKRIFEEYKKQ
ncbi:MAG: hypothetical protein IJN48_00735 [Clostridia bacterium]|nr:hypothetical protein [Clostridia bacterium]